jgi:hypothetical protein
MKIVRLPGNSFQVKIKRNPGISNFLFFFLLIFLPGGIFCEVGEKERGSGQVDEWTGGRVDRWTSCYS